MNLFSTYTDEDRSFDLTKTSISPKEMKHDSGDRSFVFMVHTASLN